MKNFLKVLLIIGIAICLVFVISAIKENISSMNSSGTSTSKSWYEIKSDFGNAQRQHNDDVSHSDHEGTGGGIGGGGGGSW